MSEKRFKKGFTKIGHINCIFEDGKETNMLFHDNDDDINPYCKDGKSDLDRVVDKLNELSDENNQLRQDLKSLETTSNATSDYNAHLEGKIITLENENEQLKRELKESVNNIIQRLDDAEKEKFKKMYGDGV